MDKPNLENKLTLQDVLEFKLKFMCFWVSKILSEEFLSVFKSEGTGAPLADKGVKPRVTDLKSFAIDSECCSISYTEFAVKICLLHRPNSLGHRFTMCLFLCIKQNTFARNPKMDLFITQRSFAIDFE